MKFEFSGVQKNKVDRGALDNIFLREKRMVDRSLKTYLRMLGLSEDQFVVSFQSRLGRTPWIKPYTDLLLPDLIKQGVKNIAVVSPSFVADCLETLEEIDIRMRKQWMALGGSEFTFIPCVNDNTVWVDVLASWVRASSLKFDAS